MKISFGVDYEPDPNLDSIDIEIEVSDETDTSWVNKKLSEFVTNLQKELEES